MLEQIISGECRDTVLGIKVPAPQIKCVDGTALSVQASASHYCAPRDDVGPYSLVEVGYLSEDPKAWEEYRDGAIYGFVPVDKVREFVALHGGLVPQATI